jgi:hypothetical protein
MCGPGKRWCARADAIFAVAGMPVLDASVPPLLTPWVSGLGQLPLLSHSEVARLGYTLRAWQMISQPHNGDVVVSRVGKSTESLRAPKT